MNNSTIVNDFVDQVGKNYRAALEKLAQHGNDAPQYLTEDESFAVCIAAGCKWEMDYQERRITVKNAGIIVKDGSYMAAQRV